MPNRGIEYQKPQEFIDFLIQEYGQIAEDKVVEIARDLTRRLNIPIYTPWEKPIN